MAQLAELCDLHQLSQLVGRNPNPRLILDIGQHACVGSGPEGFCLFPAPPECLSRVFLAFLFCSVLVPREEWAFQDRGFVIAEQT